MILERLGYRPTLTVQEVADIFAITRATASKWIEQGEIPSLRIGKTIRVLTVPLAELLGMTPQQLMGDMDLFEESGR